MKNKAPEAGNELDHTVPGGVYLCQIGENVSCGACCGLYNVADPSRDALTEMLAYRTAEYAKVPREIDAVLAFKERIERSENQERPYPEFHHCPFIGLIGNNRSRVGCLLHPLAEGSEGLDFRGLSYYGTMACRQYFCPTHTDVPARFKRLIRKYAPDWYLYGMIVTDSEMIVNFFSEIEKRLRKPLDGSFPEIETGLKELVEEFMRIKTNWPFRHEGRRHPANYFFNDRLYRPDPIDYDDLNTAKSRYDAMFKALHSKFETKDALAEAEACIDDLIHRFLDVFGDRPR